MSDAPDIPLAPLPDRLTPPPPAPASSTPDAPVAAPSAPTAPPAPIPAAAPAAVDEDDDDYGETVVVDRRPKITWNLNVDGAGTLRLTGASVLLGRKPTSTDPTVQALAVPDTTRTLSKVHARLDRVDDGWTITDLNSTNGVLLVAEDGTEKLMDPGATAPVKGRFILGKVGMSIGFES